MMDRRTFLEALAIAGLLPRSLIGPRLGIDAEPAAPLPPSEAPSFGEPTGPFTPVSGFRVALDGKEIPARSIRLEHEKVETTHMDSREMEEVVAGSPLLVIESIPNIAQEIGSPEVRDMRLDVGIEERAYSVRGWIREITPDGEITFEAVEQMTLA